MLIKRSGNIAGALASTGAVTYGAALVHLSFNVIGTVVCLTVFCMVRTIAVPTILGESTSLMGIAVIHSVFNILCTALMIPFAGLLEKLVKKMIPDNVAHGTWRSVCENKA